jgi:hypothetical protein
VATPTPEIEWAGHHQEEDQFRFSFGARNLDEFEAATLFRAARKHPACPRCAKAQNTASSMSLVSAIWRSTEERQSED